MVEKLRRILTVKNLIALLLICLILIPYICGYRVVRVVSDSMEPTIKNKSIIVEKICSIDNVKENDIITSKGYTGNIVIHRVIEVSDINGVKALVTKADNVESIDVNRTTSSNLNGKVVFILNWVSLFSKIYEGDTINTIAMVIVLLAVLYLVKVVFNRMRYSEQ